MRWSKRTFSWKTPLGVECWNWRGLIWRRLHVAVTWGCAIQMMSIHRHCRANSSRRSHRDTIHLCSWQSLGAGHLGNWLHRRRWPILVLYRRRYRQRGRVYRYASSSINMTNCRSWADCGFPRRGTILEGSTRTWRRFPGRLSRASFGTHT